MGQVTDDFGNVFRRGLATPLNVHDWQMLSQSAARLVSGGPGAGVPSRRCGDRPPMSRMGTGSGISRDITGPETVNHSGCASPLRRRT
jgi:hypothetical protein